MIESADSQATGRQRGDSSRPSGNSKATKVKSSPTLGAQIHCAIQFASGPPGTVPGAIRRANSL
jgi:hypothetical protein